MKKDFSLEDVQKIARLARIRFEQEELVRYAKELSDFSVWSEKIPQSDSVEDEFLGVQQSIGYLKFRDDKVKKDTQLQDLLDSSPVTEGNFIAVPPVHSRIK